MNAPMDLTRRQVLSAALVGLVPKSRTIAGSLVNESHAAAHALLRERRHPVPALETRRTSVVIVGAGIAGLSAAWRLAKRGVADFAILELEPEPGGNARSGANAVTAFPWAAHYVPVPRHGAAPLVHELFAELGVVRGTAWDERHLCHAPQERLFVHGRWQEGLEPAVGPTRRDRDQFARFDQRMRELHATGEFTVPVRSTTDVSPLDSLSMSAWLAREGFDSPWLRWQVDYACRDDYGARPHAVSAWAGVHYFAARAADAEHAGPLTWPEGNGWIVRRLRERLGGRVYVNAPVYRVEPQGRRWIALTPAARWEADAVIVAAPAFVAARIVAGAPAVPAFEYSPWVTANLTLERWPRERGMPPAWDNVIYDSPALGYVVATHQSLAQHQPRTVWTWYWPLADAPAREARAWLLAQDWASLKDRVLGDLARAHPDIGECVSRIDIMRLGHGMIRPTVGFRSDPARHGMREARDGLAYAHSDVSGLPLFEEAQAQGVAAADAVMGRLG